MSSAGNPLAPGSGGFAAPPAPQTNPLEMPSHAAPQPATPQLSSMMQSFGGAHSQAVARYDKLVTADGTLKKVRAELDKLLAMGDTVSEDDVMSAASGLVTAGLTPVGVAGLLADMPSTTEGMQGWIQQHDADVRQREAQLAQVTALARHEMGVQAMKILIGHAAEGSQAAPQAQPSMPPDQPTASTGNPLEPSNAG